MNPFFIYFILFLKLNVVICVPKCEDFTTCGSCVSNNFDECHWCPAEKHEGKRCQAANLIDDVLKKKWCNATEITKSIASVNITKNDDFSDGQAGDIVQFKPQRVTITSTSPGASVDFKMYYKPLKDAPLDIYFLIDNSEDISLYKDKLVDQTETIFEEMRNYTNNVFLGIGTFIEKPVLPFANPDVDLVYTFKSHLPISNNTVIFKETLNKIESGKNYDRPEDVLDGLMQAMLCKKLIGWRKDSRRIIVVMTNTFYHSAGDGRSLGAFKRHDTKCHNDNTTDTIMDYPSIAQVNQVAKENGYVIIFAYIDEKIKITRLYYEKLSEKINGAKSSSLGRVNIADIIKNEYIKIIEDVNITSESTSNIQVTIRKMCPECKAVHSEPTEFEAIVKVVSCPIPPITKELVTIRPISLKALEVEVEFSCQCDCEKQGSTQMNSDKCHGAGDYQCGICKCKPDRYGDDCKCKSDSVNPSDNYEKCKKNMNDALRCSGHGECICGKCENCHEGFTGPYCEYDVNACPRPGGKLCSGHGNCKMAQCECERGWVHSLSGIEDCGCSLDQRSCIAPYSDKVCSGNGKCSCGRCICTNMPNANDTCTGRYCDRCSSFAENRCKELEDYAYCRYLNKTRCQGKYNETDTTVVFANRTEINSPDNVEWYMANWCRVKKDESIFVFKYYYSLEDTDPGVKNNETGLILVIQKELDEKPAADIWVPVGSAIGGILLIGLLSLILWKILTDLYDEREFNQFVEKARAAGFDVNMTENPWYEPPTTTFINPAHNSNVKG